MNKNKKNELNLGTLIFLTPVAIVLATFIMFLITFIIIRPEVPAEIQESNIQEEINIEAVNEGDEENTSGRLTHREVRSEVNKNSNYPSKAKSILKSNGYSLVSSFPVNNNEWTREVYSRGGDKISITITKGFAGYIIDID